MLYMYPYIQAGYRSEWMPMLSSHFHHDFTAFLLQLQKAIHEEATAIYFYQNLIAMAPKEWHKKWIEHPYKDEKKHLRILSELYWRITGRQPVVQAAQTVFGNYKEGLLKALESELEAFESYRDLYLATDRADIRDVLFETMTDEQEHALRFSFLYHDL
ncbi:ferritin-like domain-containing protein [Fodinisporobacter ferrooxydans]|uniref:Ferritin-like domain-containing protein n=1 Tax=Fodinisporobacter ferrooxydans TaxID=2901836 RepID=A0ABY4CEZ9_9BACL|nr:ferritin-like domain-containing protein [Alicyclobacillaceae bacterium MYW30-H2]